MTKTIILSTEKAREIYKTANSDLKAILEENFERKELLGNILDRVKTVQDIWTELDILRSEDVLPYKYPRNKQERSANAFVTIQFLSKALNEGWVPDFSNTNQYKWYLWFEYKKDSGFRFCSVVCFCGAASLGLGFYYKSREIAEHVKEYFLELYQEYLPE